MPDSADTEPGFEDFTCPHCKARVGKPCKFGRPRAAHLSPVHAMRWHKWRRAMERRANAST